MKEEKMIEDHRELPREYDEWQMFGSESWIRDEDENLCQNFLKKDRE